MAIFVQSIKIETRAHGPHPGLGKVAAAVNWMLAAKALGHQQLHRLIEQFLARIAKEFLGLRVDQDNLAAAVDNHHGIRGGLQEPAELLLRLVSAYLLRSVFRD